MVLQRLVCPNKPGLLERLQNRELIITVNEHSAISSVINYTKLKSAKLTCIILQTKTPLENIDIPMEIGDIPLIIFVPTVGKFRYIEQKLDLFKQINVRIYLPIAISENIISLNMLSSLGISCAGVFNNKPPDWSKLADLMTYAILGSVLHAQIDPFSFIANNYNGKNLKWDSIYFNDPNEFLHIGAKGGVALTNDDLKRNIFVANDIDHFENINETIVSGETNSRSKKFLLENHRCAYCMGWKICMGKFSGNREYKYECESFFSEMIGVIEQYRLQNRKDNSG